MSKTDKSFLDSNRKLQNINIKIDEDMKEMKEEFLNSIKTLISYASKSLYEATSHMGKREYGVQFGKVSIIIPSHWKLKANQSSGINCNDAQIKITKTTNNNLPFTMQLKSCGQPGSYISLPYKFFTINNIFIEELTSKGKNIMREYVKLRYGVFSEEVLNNRITTFNGTDFIYSVCNSNIKINLSKAVTDDNKCSEPNQICNFKIRKNQSHNYSVMFDTETPSSKYFCNDGERPHNKFSYNLQNKKCKQKSISSVILNHRDFKNIDITNNKYEPPQFHIVQTKYRKIVFILDISASMKDYMDTIKKVIKEIVNNRIENTAEIALVTFSDYANILSKMIKVKIKENKKKINDLIDKIVANGGTNIGHGLQLGIEALGGSIFKNDTLDGTILLLSDGDNNEENEEMRYEEIVNVISTKSILTNIVSYNQSDELLNKLTKNTGGNFIHARHNTSISDIIGIFDKALESCDIKNKAQTILTEKIVFKSSNKKVPFTLDTSMGKDRKVLISIPMNKSKFEPELTDKENMKMKLIKKYADRDQIIYEFAIPNSFKSGQVNIGFNRLSLKRIKRSMNIKPIIYPLKSYRISQNEKLLYPETQLSHSVVDIVNGSTVITAAIYLSNYYASNHDNVEVLLEINYPNASIVKKIMKDDGLDDAIEGDLIFTKSILPKDLLKKGIYNFKGIIKIFKKRSLEIIVKVVNFNSLFVKNVSPPPFIDRIPPAQMQDPIITILNVELRLIQLETKATGNDVMEGKISKYQILIRSVTDYIIDKTVYAEPYENIQIRLNLSEIQLQKVLEISIRGVDNNNNFGKWTFGVPLIFK